MAYSNFGNDDGGSRPRPQMIDVSDMNLKCAECGVAITELPFKPSLDRPVFCRECNRNRKRSFRPRY